MAGHVTPQDSAGAQLTKLGFVKGSPGNFYFPEKHPHIHLKLSSATEAFMGYSEGEQHKGGVGIPMYQNRELKSFQLGIQKMKLSYPDKKNVEEVINEAAAILTAYLRKKDKT